MTKPALKITEHGDCLQAIIEKTRKGGTIDIKELLECFASKGITEQEQIDDIIIMMEDMGFKISR